MPISVVARTGLGADKNEPAYEFGVAERKDLRDVSADRETEDIDVCKSQSMDECGCLVSLRPDRIRGLTAGAGNASIVQQNAGRFAASPSVSAGSQWSMPPPREMLQE